MMFCAWFVFFLLKQKTAYEMRISDWSSDVCSSDLQVVQAVEENGEGQAKPAEVGYFSRQSGEAAKIRPAAARWRRGHFHGNPWENVYACPIRARFSTFPTAPASQPRPLATACRSAERRVGAGCVSKGRTRWSQEY